MYKFLLILLTLLLIPSASFSDGTDTVDNYIAGRGAGANMETDGTGSRATNNTFVGVSAGYADTTGSANVGLGYGVLRAITTGRANVALGFMAGQDVTTGDHGLFIHTGFYPTHGIFGDFSTGFFGVNTTAPQTAWDVTGAQRLVPQVAKFDTTGFTGGEMWYSTGDTLYVYTAGHTVKILVPASQ